MSDLSLDDFEWVEHGFDLWNLRHKTYNTVAIAAITNFNGWHVKVLLDPSMRTPLHIDTLDAAKAIAAMTAARYMETYHEKYLAGIPRGVSKRTQRDGPPPFREGVFKVD